MLYEVHKLIFFESLSSRYAPGPLVPALDSRITASTNIAYEMTKQGAQGGGQEGEHEYEMVSPLGDPQRVKFDIPPSNEKLP